MRMQYTYYSVARENENIKSAGKWMELEIVIVSKVTEAQEDKCHVFLSSDHVNIDSSDMSVTFGIPI